MKILTLILFLFSGILLNAQDYSDVERLKKMQYMRFSTGVNCQNEDASFLDQRICLNLEFQRVDSLLNTLFATLLDQTDSSKEKEKMKLLHSQWVKNRRTQSGTLSEDYRGHHLGIIYLSKMVEMTLIRIKEIEQLLSK